MSVFTPVTPDALADWLAHHKLGTATALTPIAEGVENTNYFLDSTQGRFVLTLFERLEPSALPFYLGLMQALAEHGVSAPKPFADRHGRLFAPLCGKPAAVVSRLPGKPVDDATAAHCAAIGDWLARMHLALADFGPPVGNPRGAAWRASSAEQVRPFLAPAEQALLADCLQKFDGNAPANARPLPRGVIHADLFRDNALWQDATAAQLSGVIDFYFAGVDDWLFDLAVTANDWCQRADDPATLDETRTRVLLAAYHAVRPLTADERAAWPATLCRAALRFWLSRLVDLYLPRPGDLVKVKDPDEYRQILDQRRQLASAPAAAPWLVPGTAAA